MGRAVGCKFGFKVESRIDYRELLRKKTKPWEARLSMERIAPWRRKKPGGTYGCYFKRVAAPLSDRSGSQH